MKEPFTSATADVTLLASHSVQPASSPGRLPGVPCVLFPSVLWGRLWEVPGFRDMHFLPSEARLRHPFSFRRRPQVWGRRVSGRSPTLPPPGQLGRLFAPLCPLSLPPEVVPGSPQVDRGMTEDTCESTHAAPSQPGDASEPLSGWGC